MISSIGLTRFEYELLLKGCDVVVGQRIFGQVAREPHIDVRPEMASFTGS
jgi:hypothetical protein